MVGVWLLWKHIKLTKSFVSMPVAAYTNGSRASMKVTPLDTVVGMQQNTVSSKPKSRRLNATLDATQGGACMRVTLLESAVGMQQNTASPKTQNHCQTQMELKNPAPA